jgi:hypothetical protein
MKSFIFWNITPCTLRREHIIPGTIFQNIYSVTWSQLTAKLSVPRNCEEGYDLWQRTETHTPIDIQT